MSGYYTVHTEGSGEITEKKSRFIGYIKHIQSEDEALITIQQLKKQYWDARHHCSAYVLGRMQETVRCSDDGEPGGTAGKPMLDVLLSHQLTNVLVVVIRYFGGTLLGTGGLVRAYTGAAREALQDAETIFIDLYEILYVTVDYTLSGKVHHLIATEELCVLDTLYEEKVTFRIPVLSEDVQRLTGDLIDMCSGQADISVMEKAYGGIVEGRFIKEK